MGSPTVTEVCGEDPGAVCEWVYERTDGNETVTRIAEFLVNRPLQIIGILLVAWIASAIVRRWVGRAVHRIIAPDRETAAKHLGRLGLGVPQVLEAELTDPRRETRATVISSVVAGTASIAIWTIALITVADRLGVALGPLIASAGIAGVALGFGAQSLVKDWIAGLFMLIEDQYGIGDVVDLGEASGVVERFTLRATVLRGVDGTVWHVPNGVVVRVGNKSQLWSVALLDVTVAHTADLALATSLLREAATEVCARPEHADQVLEPPEVLGVEALVPEGVTLRASVKTTPGSQWAVQRALREAVKATFERGGVELPLSQRQVWVRPEQAGGPANPPDRPS